MLSYQHAYHAGNFADVVKHVVLAILLKRLAEKPKGFSYFDTHAGRGIYPVSLPEMVRKPEFLDGVMRVWRCQTDAPEGILGYLEVLRRVNKGEALEVVPGSPTVARYLSRDADTLHVCELHPTEASELQRALGGDKRVRIYKADGYEKIPALLPPPTSRGVIVIDPSYEVKSDYVRVVEVVTEMFRRWPQACVLVWYPLLADARHATMVKGLIDLGIPATWVGEVMAAPHASGMRGTGQLVLGMPWKLDGVMDAAVRWLAPVLGGDAATADCRIVVEPV